VDALTAYYDSEAYRYDATRGGQARAQAAAVAASRLLREAAPNGVPGPVLDLGTGTGTLLVALSGLGHSVVGLDRSTGMLSIASGRCAGKIVRADVGALPVRDAAVGAVTAVWLLQLFPPDTVDAIVGEVARVLAPGGVFVSTVDKSTARRGRLPDPAASDHGRSVGEVAAGHGLVEAGSGTFVGVGEGAWREDHAMPPPPGADPVYPLAAWRRPGPGQLLGLGDPCARTRPERPRAGEQHPIAVQRTPRSRSMARTPGQEVRRTVNASASRPSPSPPAFAFAPRNPRSISSRLSRWDVWLTWARSAASFRG
jgi:ubiquinone/menaquinone biosynthesis C-methylase UbiE